MTAWRIRQDGVGRRYAGASMTGRFGGVLTAMVTPFDDEGALDLDAARDLARLLVANGNDGLVVAGTTGEARCSPTTSGWRCSPPWPRRSRSRSSPAPAPTTPPTRCTSPPRRRKLGVAGILAVVPVLQPPVAGRHRGPLAGRRRGHRPAGDDLRHPDPHRPQDRHRRRCCAWPARCPTSSALKDAAGNPAETAAADRRRARTASRSTAATTR